MTSNIHLSAQYSRSAFNCASVISLPDPVEDVIGGIFRDILGDTDSSASLGKGVCNRVRLVVTDVGRKGLKVKPDATAGAVDDAEAAGEADGVELSSIPATKAPEHCSD
jgi:hypothetical protein